MEVSELMLMSIVPKEREEQFSKAGIIAFHGRGRFIGQEL